MARSSVVKAGERGLSPQGRAPRSFCPEVRRFCRDLVRPTPVLVLEAGVTCGHLLDGLAYYTAMAFSPLGSRERSVDAVTRGHWTLQRVLELLDALFRVPLVLLENFRFRLQRHACAESAFRELSRAAHAAVHLGTTLDRAARELGMEPFDGGPFAVASGGETPALPGRPLLAGGAR